MNVSRVDLGVEDRQRRHVRHLARAERLHAGARRRRSSSGSRTSSRRCLASPASPTSLVPLLAATTGATASRCRASRPDPDTDTDARYNEVGAGYFRTLGIPLMAGRDFTAADAVRRAEGRDRQRGVREEVQPRRDAVGKRMSSGRGGSARHRDRRPRAEREVQRGQGRDPAGVLPAVSAGSGARRDQLLRPHRRRSGADPGGDSEAGRRLDPNLPVEDLRTLPQQVQRERVPRSHHHACCPRPSPCWRRCSPRSACTACWPTRWRSARARSGCGWRSAPRRRACAAWCCVRSAG